VVHSGDYCSDEPVTHPAALTAPLNLITPELVRPIIIKLSGDEYEASFHEDRQWVDGISEVKRGQRIRCQGRTVGKAARAHLLIA
jgi:hypothetical protein